MKTKLFKGLGLFQSLIIFQKGGRCFKFHSIPTKVLVTLNVIEVTIFFLIEKEVVSSQLQEPPKTSTSSDT